MDVGKILSGAVKTALGVATGGFSDRVAEIAEGIFGDSMTPEQSAQLKIAIEKETTSRIVAGHEAAAEAEKNLTERIAQLEGTAKDLLALPVIGRLMIFLRGAQRPVWGFGTLYLDMMVFSKQWPIEPNSMTEIAFWTINLLVLMFLFGERAVANVAPLVLKLLGRGG